MALIKCPECGREISDKAKMCIHCGYPLDKLGKEASQNDNDPDVDYPLENCPVCDTYTWKYNGKTFNQNYASNGTVDNFICDNCGFSAMVKNRKILVCDDYIKKQNELNQPKCPTCGSTNIKKISGLSKAGSVAMFGLFSQKVRHQWHCNNCGSDF